MVYFLTTRVREPNKYDWLKIVQIMNYIRGTRDIPLILGTNVSGVLKWWIDESYAEHTNMWGHTGVGLSIGRGFTIVTLTNQKINTHSSNE